MEKTDDKSDPHNRMIRADPGLSRFGRNLFFFSFSFRLFVCFTVLSRYLLRNDKALYCTDHFGGVLRRSKYGVPWERIIRDELSLGLRAKTSAMATRDSARL